MGGTFYGAISTLLHKPFKILIRRLILDGQTMEYLVIVNKGLFFV
jgi:hypothetical protein